MENGVCDYLKLWVFTGIPFGVQRMYFWMVPKGYDIGATAAIFVLNLLTGGVIGGCGTGVADDCSTILHGENTRLRDNVGSSKDIKQIADKEAMES